MSKAPPRPPGGLGASGRKLWRAVTGDYEISEHESVVLREICRTADSIDLLQVVVDEDGVMSESSQGVRAHPALAELRQQRVTLARLYTALRIPLDSDSDDEGRRTQRRGVTHGVYPIRGA